MNIISDISDKISFISCIIPEFADSYKMSIANAYKFLKNMVDQDNACVSWRLYFDR